MHSTVMNSVANENKMKEKFDTDHRLHIVCFLFLTKPREN